MKRGGCMESYSVKQIAEMLNTQPETVRRWIRTGKLTAHKNSRKEGHVISENDLSEFLKKTPKYAGFVGMAGSALSSIAMTTPLAAVAVSSVAGGALASHILQGQKNKKNELFSKDDLKRYLRQEIMRRSNSINQKQLAIEKLQREITIDQQQITECNLAISKLDKEKYQE